MSSNPNSEVQPWFDTYLFKAGCEQFSPETKLCLYYILTPQRRTVSCGRYSWTKIGQEIAVCAASHRSR